MTAGVPAAIVLLGLIVVFFFFTDWNRWVGQRPLQRTDDAYLKSDLTPLSARVAGYVRRVDVADYQRVTAGQMLFEIEDADYRAQLAQADANVAAAQAAIDNLHSQMRLQLAVIAQAVTRITATRADLERDARENWRQKALLATRLAGTQQRVEQTEATQKKDEAALAGNEAELERQRRQLAVLGTQAAQLEADLAAKQAARDLARITLGYTRIVAPASGVVGLRQVQAGQFVNVGTRLVTLAPDGIWVLANYKETQLMRMRVGQPATVRVDSLPALSLRGRVQTISPASGAEFALLPPDNATGNFTKIVQRLTVKIVLDAGQDGLDQLRPGMSVEAAVDTGGGATGAATGGRAP